MNQPTRYELSAISPEGAVYLAGYVRIPSQDGAMRMIRQHADSWTRILTSNNVTASGKGRMGFTLHCGGWSWKFTGRTQREAQNNELTWFKTILN